MENLIIQALDQAVIKLETRISQTKKIGHEKSIMDVKPTELLDFMKENNIPDTADFSGHSNSYDAYDDFVLYWETTVPSTDADKDKERNHLFSQIAFKAVYDLLTANGYARHGFSTHLLKEFDDTTVYKMYITKDFDRLLKYYSLPFSLKIEG